ncbi:MAG: LysM peptidoglycan-binding domain-containing protein [Caldilineaceae bacterium]
MIFSLIAYASPTISLLAQPLAHPATQERQNTHTVQAGETLSEIAKAYGVPLTELMALNGITDADEIDAGQVLELPATIDSATDDPATATAATPTALPTYAVQTGETLSEIAQKFHLTLTRLMLFNGIRNADEIYVGQELIIPPPDEEETTAAAPTSTAASGPKAMLTPPDAPSQPTATVITTALQPADETSSSETTDTTPLTDLPVARLTTSLNRIYTVREGDTLPRIALRSGVDVDALRLLNRLTAESATQLVIGQELLLPALGEDLLVQAPAREYEVQPGDSLGAIAKHFELTMADLLSANWITDPNSIVVGQRLTIPGKVTESDAPHGRVGPQRRGFYYYTVQPGDTLSELAQVFNSTKLALLEYNGLPDEGTLYAGLEIRIPYGPPALPDQRPPTPASGTSFLVSLSRQQCWLFAGGRVAYAWMCSTGYGEWITRTGTFAVQSKIDNAPSSAYRLDMPYWLGIYNVGPYENGIHGLPVDWDTGEKIWDGLIGEPATFGCAMLDDKDAKILYDTAYIGMPIHIIH